MPRAQRRQRLEETLRDALDAFPAARVCIVPVGLGRPAGGEALGPWGEGGAARVLEAVERFQAVARGRLGRRLFYAADEFYILAGAPFPPAGEYEGFPQLENGIGLARDFIDAAREVLKERVERAVPARTAVLTGGLGAGVLEEALRFPGGGQPAGVELVRVENRLFGPGVTVTGLAAGADVKRESDGLKGYGRVLVPAVMLRDGVFLDGLGFEELRKDAASPVRIVENDGAALVEALYEAEEGS